MSKSSPQPPSLITDHELVLVPKRLAVQIDGEEWIVTPTQFQILAVLAAEPGRVFRRAELVQWGIGAMVTERTVDAHIKQLRLKLGQRGKLIETVRGIGYRLRERPSTAEPVDRKNCA